MRACATTSGLEIERKAKGGGLASAARGRVLAGAMLGMSLILAAPAGWASQSGALRNGVGRSSPRAPGYLGIEFHDLTDEQANALHLRRPHGVEVLMVDHDGPASQSGVKAHDIITGMNGNVVPSGEALRRMIHDTGAGVPIVLNVFRDGHTLTIQTKLANREDVERRAWARVTTPDPQPANAPAAPGVAESFSGQPSAAPARGQSFIGSMLHGPFTGMMLENMQPQLASFFGAPKGEGLLVQAVQAGSPAALAGVAAADVILRADGVTLRTTSDWTKHLHAKKGSPISLGVLRQHREMTLTLQPDSKKK